VRAPVAGGVTSACRARGTKAGCVPSSRRGRGSTWSSLTGAVAHARGRPRGLEGESGGVVPLRGGLARSAQRQRLTEAGDRRREATCLVAEVGCRRGRACRPVPPVTQLPHGLSQGLHEGTAHESDPSSRGADRPCHSPVDRQRPQQQQHTDRQDRCFAVIYRAHSTGRWSEGARRRRLHSRGS
jgi:hypothetical protein